LRLEARKRIIIMTSELYSLFAERLVTETSLVALILGLLCVFAGWLFLQERRRTAMLAEDIYLQAQETVRVLEALEQQMAANTKACETAISLIHQTMLSGFLTRQEHALEQRTFG
jgi:hypothetical protein